MSGADFVSSSVVNWNGSPLATTFVNGSVLKAAVPASDTAAATTATITVTNPTPAGGVSNPAYFHVAQASSVSFVALPQTAFPPPDPTIPAIYAPATVGDFNNDGILDVLASQSDGSSGANIAYLVSLGVGDGTFQPPKLVVGISASSNDVIGDFNNDGKLDILIAYKFTLAPASSATLYLGNGDGTFTASTLSNISYNSPGSGNAPVLTAGDFNRDGNLDLAWSDPSGFSVSLGNGDGTFQSATSYSGLSGSSAPGQLLTTDFNADGKLDVVLTYAGQNTFATFQGNGDGTFQAAQSVTLTDPVYQMAISDVNSDATPDLVVSTGYATGTPAIKFQTLIGNGDGTFQAPTTVYSPGDCDISTSQCVAPAFAIDAFSGNGFADFLATSLITTGSSQNPALIIGNGDGTFQSASYPGFSLGAYTQAASPNPYILVSGDFNRDGHPDLLGWVNSTATGATLPNAAVLLQGNIPVASLNPTTENFMFQALGTASDPRVVTLTNTGMAPLLISSITGSGDFSQTNNCPSSLAAGTNCTINVVFTPSTTDDVNGAITITDNAPGGTHLVSLKGSTASTAVATFSPSSVTFGGQLVGTTSLPQNVTITNTGTAPLTIANISSSSPDYAATSGCSGDLAPAATCSIGVFFAPKAGGNSSGQLVITSNSYGSPQSIPLSGVGQDFAITSQSGNSSISQGQTATYTLSVAPSGGFNQPVSLTCTGAPSLSTCSVSPTSVQLNGTSPTAVTVSVTTTAASAAAGLQGTNENGPGTGFGYRISALGLLALAGCAVLAQGGKRRRLVPVFAAIGMFCFAAVLSSCSGSGSKSGNTGAGSPGTTAGTYNLTVTGTSTAGTTTLTHAVTVSVTVH